jgi:hypothetical protein
MKKLLSALIFAVMIFGAVNSPAMENGQWRKVLSFKVVDTSRNHKADIGEHKILIARADEMGWDLGVYYYPVTSESLNLLYDGQNLHGPQPWHVMAWSKHDRLFPDERIVTYGKKRAELRIILFNCKTKKVGDAVRFTEGRVVVYHRP